ncbi:hypothetical protein RB614_24215 [Phytohabitans sp. ZYX-F-186]|uniref:Uncharacterized protein n=1 Tax=Phytohabitans maris TaxID=3071409 RepID=A0ABU0ZKQ7_9ACTN|nr:hypothetical protein [Phytohabitans sp. ZYX-F-186]MDQ7907631.1 hypothetical protein [Phytohabitans sp. ZYX-F-186]
MGDVERFDPDAAEYGEGLFGRVLAAAPRSGRADADLGRLLDRDARAMLELAVRRAGEGGSLSTGTDDLFWAACRDERGVSVLRMCGVDTAEILRRLPGTQSRPAPSAPALTRGSCRVLMAAAHIALQRVRRGPACRT